MKRHFRYESYRGPIIYRSRQQLIRFLFELGRRPDGTFPTFTEDDPSPLRPHCPNGHPYTESDLARTGKPWRCAQCHRENRRRYKAKKRAKGSVKSLKAAEG